MVGKLSRAELGDVLISALQKMPGRPKTEQELEEEVSQRCKELWLIDREKELQKEQSLRVIPRLFARRDFAPSSIAEHTRREARIRMLKRQETLLLENEELQDCHALLLQHACSLGEEGAASGPDAAVEDAGANPQPLSKSEHALLNYDGFCQVRALLPAKFEHYFDPSSFARFRRDENGAISLLALYQYIICRDALLRKRITLAWYDFGGAGFLREADLENFLQDEITNSPILESLEASFQTFYVCTAVRKFFFFLDPQRRHKIRIKELVKSPILDDLLMLRQRLPEDDPNLITNWFSPASAKRVYGQYLRLDANGNGMLSQQELLQYEGAYLTEAFVQRVFEECQTYDGEMDFKSFLDFVLAMEHRSTQPALHYFWRVLDLRKRGSIGVFEIHFFFRHIRAALIETGHPAAEIADVTDEIFDMVKPVRPDQITLDDLFRSGVGETVVSILTDMQAFYHYDNRESLMQHTEEHT